MPAAVAAPTSARVGRYEPQLSGLADLAGWEIAGTRELEYLGAGPQRASPAGDRRYVVGDLVFAFVLGLAAPRAGEVLIDAGSQNVPFFVVRSGTIEITIETGSVPGSNIATTAMARWSAGCRRRGSTSRGPGR